MKLVDVDNITLDYSGLVFIYPYDFERTASYFARQIHMKPEVEAVPYSFIRERIEKAAGTESTYLSELLEEWEKVKREYI
ncbi:MAG: hypothetical protein Q4D71_13160 [Oscillospiraceae bacterium]|nr:hypothetical protein [Oscillospiraceae bacterium]